MSNIKSSSEEYELYKGPRDINFINFIKGLLSYGNLKKKYINVITDENSIIEYSKAFTHMSASTDKNFNYEIYEQLGDVTANGFIVWYMYRRFPQLNCVDGVKIVARLRINYGSKQSFSKIAEKLGFWKYISSEMEIRNTKKKPLLEDTFEAFLGATQYLLDKRIKLGVGYAIVYNILTTIFDKMPISLSYNDLYDAKTRLKETYDHFDKTYEPKYIETRNEDKLVFSNVYHGPKNSKFIMNNNIKGPNPSWNLIGTGIASLKADAQQKAAEQALITLAKINWVKPIPDIYKVFCT